MKHELIMVDGNEAAARVAYQLSEVCAIYPITPSSTMAELADAWAAEGQTNLWGNIPTVVEMQSEGGAAGTVHGALQAGALATTFTASQGLMLMLPNMYKIAGELTSAVFHVAARSLAAQGLSIFGDHQDVMAARSTGFAMLASGSVQEAQDLALVAHSVTLQCRVPFIHFFDGFRTSHEVNKITALHKDEIRALIDNDWVRAHRSRALNPDHPVMRGTAQNPDTYFQSRESVNPFYEAVPARVQQCMESLGELTGRHYRLVEYHGAPDATDVIVLMGSGAATARTTVDWLNRQDRKTGVLVIRLYRPFPVQALLDALPESVRRMAVLDRTKEPGAGGEPLLLDVQSALIDGLQRGLIKRLPWLSGGRYGLSSKEFTPAMCAAVFEELASDAPRPRFTVGIVDDVSGLSLAWHPIGDLEPASRVRALFFGLGADGTVGANKNSIKIIGELEGFHAQGYFVYDSKKSGSRTVSHLRFGPEPIDAPWLIEQASFIGCHQWGFVESVDLLEFAAEGATLLLNAPHEPERVWAELPERLRARICALNIQLYCIDGDRVAERNGMGNRINTIMQTCFFALAGILPRDEAIALIKESIEKSYARKGPEVVARNFAAVDDTLAHLHRVAIPAGEEQISDYPLPLAPGGSEFVQRVTGEMLAGRGDRIPVSMLPVDGTYPTATSRFEKRDIAREIPIWNSDICIQCGNCVFVCPHAALRAKFYHQDWLATAPEAAQSVPVTAKGFPDSRYTLQLYPEDCTGCGQCVQACPVRVGADENGEGERAIAMMDKAPHLAGQKQALRWFESLPWPARERVDFSTVRGAQFLEPLFEFSGACAGCGETPYLKLLTQLFGDRMLVANATGCSSIYGGNLPTTPWAKNGEGKGPAWSNSLFEDNAEFGFGFRLTADQHHGQAVAALQAMKGEIGVELVETLVSAPQRLESEIRAQRTRVAQVRERLEEVKSGKARELLSLIDQLVRRSVWIIGGDGWAYDIGSAGLDHVLASGRDVNVLVMDTEVYSNTGGQMSKSTPLGAVAKFAAGGKTLAKKDVALQAISYGNVYVARIAFGANPQQALQALREAEAYPGPSLIIAYSHCIAHGIDMEFGLTQQKRAVASGHWPLMRYNPVLRSAGQNPFSLDSLRPSIPLAEYRQEETRYRVLAQSHPQEAERLMQVAQQVAWQKWATYEEMATREASHFHPPV
ncbi:pyruvate:ferredoxin (flavodoxin) oxidoreductase [Aeromonas hydrophila]|uniref:pyruvate:ferredoxin (flavodoxin) oxidoreductase n=1 Tax=Aeromonas hydrophila TaxID=644 RepID=UPI00191D6049|nr:pyruvate:ferredoxin (flavodoxin) oxidoreductase [Aeromonas hydrophila]MBL0560466.1 pyruvate:ferredoxin (flavodoxin) oxidoreductase [Aeromonas hydrophila]